MRTRSQSGGEHWFYRKTSIPVRESSGLLAQHVDIKGDVSGKAFAWPTVVANGGGAYEPVAEIHPVGNLPEFPVEWAKMLADKRPTKRTLPVPPATPAENVSETQRDRLMRIVEYKLDELRDAPPGVRFDASKVAMRIIGIGKALGTEDELAQRIRDAFPGDDDQIDGSIDRAISNADPEVLPEDDVRGFWDQRPELQHIRQAAYARYLSPWAVLGAVLVRVLGDAKPGCYVDAGLGLANLNLFTVIMGPSGGGKGGAINASADLWPSYTYHCAPCSGEALPNLFMRKERGGDGEWTDKCVRESVIIQSPEFATTSASGNRQGSTLIPQLCAGFSGENLAFTKADSTKNFDEELLSYRLGLIAGLQDGNAYMLLSEGMTTTGLAQRLVWLPAREATPKDKPAWPGPLDQSGVRSLPERHIAEVCDWAVADVNRDQWEKNQPGGRSNPLDAHRLFIRLKVAYALAVMNGHPWSVRDADWELAGIVMTVSDATRQSMVDAMHERDRKRAVAAGKRDGQRRASADDTADEESIKRAADSIERWLHKQPAGGTEGQLRQALSSARREKFPDALDLLTAEGRISARGESWYVSA